MGNSCLVRVCKKSYCKKGKKACIYGDLRAYCSYFFSCIMTALSCRHRGLCGQVRSRQWRLVDWPKSEHSRPERLVRVEACTLLDTLNSAYPFPLVCAFTFHLFMALFLALLCFVSVFLMLLRSNLSLIENIMPPTPSFQNCAAATTLGGCTWPVALDHM
jgi:hypothetical protein